jgi:hypothetical protein
MLATRQALSHGNPSWLAYSLYADPNTRVTFVEPESESLS